jgi:hypothetical protein
MMTNVKHPEVKVKLVGKDGNAFSILGRVMKAMRRARLPREEVNAFTAEATSGDYDHLLRTVMEWVDVDGSGEEEEEYCVWEIEKAFPKRKETR